MKIGVISDTHVPRAAERLPGGLLRGLAGVDLILHAGDILEPSVLDELRAIAPVEAVRGNMDNHPALRDLPVRRVIVAAGRSIGLTHGSGAPQGLAARVLRMFEGVDCVVFGHSHAAFNETINGVLLFNPGTPTDRRFSSSHTYGIIEIADTITGRIIDLD